MTDAQTRDDPRRDAVLGAVLGAFAVFVWAGTPAAFTFANQGFDPLVSGALRTVLAAPVAVVALAVLARGGVRVPLDRAGLILLLVAGVGGYGCYPLVFSVGIDRTSTGHVGLILAILPVQTAAMSFLLERRWPNRSWVTGVAIAVAGEAVLFLGGEVDPESRATLAGDLIVLGSTLFAAAAYIAGARLGSRMGFVGGTFACVLAGSAVLAPFLLVLSPEIDWRAVSAPALGGLGYLCVMSVILGYMAWFAALAKGGVHRVAPIQFVQPLLTLVLGVILFDERVDWVVALAAALILSGVWLTRRTGAPPNGERR